MDIFYSLVLLTSIAGNILAFYLLYKLQTRTVSEPKQLYNERKTKLAPFVEPMKDADQRDLSEVDDEILKESVRTYIARRVVPVISDKLEDDEEKQAVAKEFMT